MPVEHFGDLFAKLNQGCGASISGNAGATSLLIQPSKKERAHAPQNIKAVMSTADGRNVITRGHLSLGNECAIVCNLELP